MVLPLSPNHGVFGGDGLYAESKLALEALFNKWHSESWSNYLHVVGAVIGWTRGRVVKLWLPGLNSLGTGLMNDNDLLAPGMEEMGVRTFSTREMAFNIIGLLHREVRDILQKQPLSADLNGGMNTIPSLNKAISTLRKSLKETCDIRQAVATDAIADQVYLTFFWRIRLICSNRRLSQGM